MSTRTLDAAALKSLQSLYPVGQRVEFISMDCECDLLPGDEGTVFSPVEEDGTVHVAWDNGSPMVGIIYGVDHIKPI